MFGIRVEDRETHLQGWPAYGVEKNVITENHLQGN